MQITTQHAMNTKKNLCIQNCIDTNRTCLETIAYCLQRGGAHSNESHIRLLHDCVEICQTSADFMIRSSTFYPQICGSCEAICKATADACEQVVHGDKMMQECADICRRCAESCSQCSDQ